MRPRSEQLKGALLGLAAAALFGLSAPLAKLLLPSIQPLALAGLLYLGGGSGLAAYGAARRLTGVRADREARLGRRDVPLLLGVIITGGIVGPVLMLVGLQRLSGMTASLLLNLEGPLTMLLAVVAFGEHLGRRGAAASACIVGGAAMLELGGGDLRGDWIGAFCVAGACASWAVDNNLTQRLSLKDPASVVRWKALGAGSCVLAVALLSGQRLPGAGVVSLAFALGAASYGASILLDMYALRILGAAREAAYFATAPFLGALAAIPLLGERPSVIDGLAAALMVAGVATLLRERHEHLHAHRALEHEHLHVHDEHHPHDHAGQVAEPHGHVHRHEPLSHDHPHVPDLHHRHEHD